MKTAAPGVAGNVVQCNPVGLGLQQKFLLPVFPIIHSVVDEKQIQHRQSTLVKSLP